MTFILSTDVLRVVTTSSATLHCLVAFAEQAGTSFTFSRQSTTISSATTTTILSSAGSGNVRNPKQITIFNNDSSNSQTFTIEFYNGTTAYVIFSATLGPQQSIKYTENIGWLFYDSSGRVVDVALPNSYSVGTVNNVTLGSDVVNNNAVANTYQDVTGLSFNVNSGEVYSFEFYVPYSSAATTTGSRWGLNGPTFSYLTYQAIWTLTATTVTTFYGQAYDAGTVNATSLTNGNYLRLNGLIKPNASGTVILRFASEVSGSAITALTGGILSWVRTA